MAYNFFLVDGQSKISGHDLNAAELIIIISELESLDECNYIV